MGEHIEIDTGSGPVRAYRADPPAAPRGAVVVVHEVWGLVPHIEDVADRLAAAGYLAVAPDILSRAGIDPATGAELQQLMFSADAGERATAQPRLRDALSAANSPDYAAWAVTALRGVVDAVELDGVEPLPVAVVGFCFGGSYAWALALADPRVRVTVPFYGTPPNQTELHGLGGSVLAFYGENDERVTSTLTATATALRDAPATFTPIVYPGVGHAFFNDTNPVTYDESSARDAWTKVLDALDAGLPARG